MIRIIMITYVSAANLVDLPLYHELIPLQSHQANAHRRTDLYKILYYYNASGDTDRRSVKGLHDCLEQCLTIDMRRDATFDHSQW